VQEFDEAVHDVDDREQENRPRSAGGHLHEHKTGADGENGGCRCPQPDPEPGSKDWERPSWRLRDFPRHMELDAEVGGDRGDPAGGRAEGEDAELILRQPSCGDERDDNQRRLPGEVRESAIRNQLRLSPPVHHQ
jgi:hypothetical protein